MASFTYSVPKASYDRESLLKLASCEGPFLTVSLPLDKKINPQENHLRFAALKEDLISTGVSKAQVDDVENLYNLNPGPHFYYASCPSLTHTETLPQKQDPLGLYNDLPALTPLLKTRQSHIPHVKAAVSRTGAVVYCFDETGSFVCKNVEVAEDDFVHQSAPQGSARHAVLKPDAKARDTWMHHAKSIASEIDASLTDIDGEYIVLSGDIRELSLVEEYLTSKVRLFNVRGSKANDGSDLFNEEDLQKVQATLQTELNTQLLESLHTPKQGATTPAEVVEALEQSRVELLLVAELPLDKRTVWFDTGPNQLALSETKLRALGSYTPKVARLIDGCVATALKTGAQVRVVSNNELPSGLGVLLRW